MELGCIDKANRFWALVQPILFFQRREENILLLDWIVVHGTKGSMRLSTFKDDGIVLTTVGEAEDPQGAAGGAETKRAGDGSANDGVDANDPRRGDQEGSADGNVSETFAFAKPEHAHQPLVQMVVNELRGIASSPSTGDNALRVAQVIDDALASFYGGRADAFWEREGRWPGQRVGRAPKE